MDVWEAIDELGNGALRADEATARGLLDLATPVLLGRAKRRAFVRGITREDLKDEVAQNTLLSVWQYREKYRGRSAKEFWGWFYRLCDSRVVDLKRGMKRSHEDRTSPLDMEPEARPNPSATTPDAEEIEALEYCLQFLLENDPKYYDVVSLIFHGTMTEREVGKILDRPKATVHKQKVSALRALADCLKNRGIC